MFDFDLLLIVMLLSFLSNILDWDFSMRRLRRTREFFLSISCSSFSSGTFGLLLNLDGLFEYSDPYLFLNDSYLILVGDFDIFLGEGMFTFILEALALKRRTSGVGGIG